MSKPIRILHVLGKTNIGGAETMVMNLYRNINRNEIQFDFMVHTEDRCSLDDEIISLGGRIYHVPNYRVVNHLQYVKAWDIFFKQHKEYHIIHAHMTSVASIYMKVAKKYGLSTIAHSHGSSNGIGVQAIAKKTLRYPIRYISDYLFSCSQLASEWLYGRKAVLLLVGDGELRIKIEQKVSALGLSDVVIFAGAHSDITQFMQATDVFVFPSLSEGFPVALLETQANGLRCVISDAITDEVQVTNLVEIVSLKDPVGVWVDKILESSNISERRDTSGDIKAAGYDINDTAKWLADFYMEVSQRYD